MRLFRNGPEAEAKCGAGLLAGGARAGFSGRDFHRLFALQGGLAKGPLASLASLPCRGIGHSLKEQTHQEKLRKGEAKGRSHIYHTSLHDTTLVHMGVRFTCPGRDAEGQEHGLRWEKTGVRPHGHAPALTPRLQILPSPGPGVQDAGTLRPELWLDFCEGQDFQAMLVQMTAQTPTRGRTECRPGALPLGARAGGPRVRTSRPGIMARRPCTRDSADVSHLPGGKTGGHWPP